jgi:Transposase
VLRRKKFTQKQLLTYTANLQTFLIGLEPWSGTHFLGRALRQQGHEVRLIAAQFVKPFVKSNKNDFVDAEGIAEAVERKNMRFVPIKTDDQLDLQAIHRVRDRLVARHTPNRSPMTARLIRTDTRATHLGQERHAPLQAEYILRRLSSSSLTIPLQPSGGPYIFGQVLATTPA